MSQSGERTPYGAVDRESPAALAEHYASLPRYTNSPDNRMVDALGVLARAYLAQRSETATSTEMYQLAAKLVTASSRLGDMAWEENTTLAGTVDQMHKVAVEVSERLKGLAVSHVATPDPRTITKARFLGAPGGLWWYPGRRELYMDGANLARHADSFEWKDDPAPVEHGGTGMLWPFVKGENSMLYKDPEPEAQPSSEPTSDAAKLADLIESDDLGGRTIDLNPDERWTIVLALRAYDAQPSAILRGEDKP